MDLSTARTAGNRPLRAQLRHWLGGALCLSMGHRSQVVECRYHVRTGENHLSPVRDRHGDTVAFLRSHAVEERFQTGVVCTRCGQFLEG